MVKNLVFIFLVLSVLALNGLPVTKSLTKIYKQTHEEIYVTMQAKFINQAGILNHKEHEGDGDHDLYNYLNLNDTRL